MASLDDFDADLLETEEAIQRIEEQLRDLQPSPLLADAADAGRRGADHVPGRWCRAGHVPRWRPVPSKGAVQARSERRERGTFGSASRFAAAQELEGDFLLNPLDDCLSTTTVAKGAKIYSDSVKPRQIWEAKKWLETMAEHSKCQEAFELLQVQPASLSTITQAWEVLLAEEQRHPEGLKHHPEGYPDGLDGLDGSTDAGSELPELLSVSSAASSVPGPGSYSPNYEVLRPSLAKGAPSFSRYSAREVARQEDEAESQDSTTMTDATKLLEGSNNEAPGFTCPGGIILPPHTTRPRRPTSSQQDLHSAALRPLGPDPFDPFEANAAAPAVAESTEVGTAPPWSKACATKRLEPVVKVAAPGPGDYEVPDPPGGPSVVFAPESDVMAKEEATPGPAQYDLRTSEGLVYPRAPGGNFGLSRPDVMEHQQCPDYVANYDVLEMNFQQVEPRAPSALILPEESDEALGALEIMKHRAPSAGTGVRLGPGCYQEEDTILQRLRPDRMVLPWRPRQEGVAEHLLGLHQHYTRFGRWRLDARALLGVDDDLALRRNRPRAFIQPPHQLKRSWSAEDLWRFYLPPMDEPKSHTNFARNLDFDDWQEKEKHWRWLAVRHFFRTRPSLRLSYSLPDLELVKDRAPEVDFSKAPGRSPSAEEDEEVEGDVLVLDTETALSAVQPRALGAVDMAKQLGRDDDNNDEGLVDDFEELVLSPKRLERRSSCFVDMAKESGRPTEPPWDPHIWAEEPERVFCYQPTTEGDNGEEVLDLSPASAQRRLLKRVPTYDWASCMGRPGHDPRVPELEDQEAPVLLTNYEEPFVAPPRPPRPPGDELPPDLDPMRLPEPPSVAGETELPAISYQDA